MLALLGRRRWLSRPAGAEQARRWSRGAAQASLTPPPSARSLPQAIFTLLPLRVGVALLALGRSLLSPGSGGGTPSAGGAGGAFQPGPPARLRGLRQLRGDQLFDLLGAAMSLGVVLFLWNLNAGTLYFWMKVRGCVLWAVGASGNCCGACWQPAFRAGAAAAAAPLGPMQLLQGAERSTECALPCRVPPAAALRRRT